MNPFLFLFIFSYFTESVPVPDQQSKGNVWKFNGHSYNREKSAIPTFLNSNLNKHSYKAMYNDFQSIYNTNNTADVLADYQQHKSIQDINQSIYNLF